jgi:hypothetical protein
MLNICALLFLKKRVNGILDDLEIKNTLKIKITDYSAAVFQFMSNENNK